ncbi:MAG: hypothetical protein R3D67_15110 [Hyphomicrobiaceae bacterium]
MNFQASKSRSYVASLMASLLLVFASALGASAAIDVNKSFSPATVYPNQISRLEIRLLNSALTPAVNTAFTDVFPDDVFVSATPNIVSTCGGTSTGTNTSTRGELTVAGGVIPAGDGTNPGVCTITLDVYAAKKGTYINTIPVGDVTATSGGSPDSNTQAAQGTLAVILQDLVPALDMGLSSFVQGYESTTYTITLTNPNPVPLTGAAFSYDLWQAGYNVRAVNAGSTTCGSGTVAITPRPARTTAYGPTSQIDFSGGTIPASGSCVITFDVEPSRDPQLPLSSSGLTHRLPVNAVTTNEGATNSAEATRNVYAYTGIRILKYFNNATAATTNLNDTTTAELRLYFQNYNTQDVSNFNLTDVLPTSPAQMSIVSVTSNTCGGTIGSSTTSLAMSGATLPGAQSQQAGGQIGFCEIKANVSYSTAGTYVNTVPAGDLASHQYTATQATLTVSGRILEVTKSFSTSSIYQGDSVNVTFAMTNYSSSTPITNIDLTDDLNSMCVGTACPNSGIRVAAGGVVSNTCGGTPVAVPNATSFQLNDMVLAAGASCSVTVALKAAADAFPVSQWRYNTIPVGGITFDTPTNPGQTYPIQLQGQVVVYPALRVYKYWDPTEVGPLGVARLRIRVLRYSNDHFATSGLALTDNLPAGFAIASSPNVSNGCGGTLNAPPAGTSITLSGGSIPAPTGTTQECSIYVDIRAAALTPPATVQNFTNNIPGDAHGSPVNVSAIDDGQAAPYNTLENYYAASAAIQVRATSVSANKEFTPVAVNGGAPSRVTITLSNVEPTAINLTGVSLTDSFAGTDMRLYSNVDAKFTDVAGNPNANGCRGGVFTGAPGAQSISLTAAEVDKGKICKFSFNITAFKGGNHINTLAAGDLVTNEGVTNNANVAATLTVGRQVNVGKGFAPNFIAAGEQSTLTIDFYNTNVAPNNETGASPALIDTLPAGLSIVGVPTTNCSGGTVTTGTSAGAAFIRLDGGTFVAESACQIYAQVTASSAGVYTNTIPRGDLTTLSGAQNPDEARADLRVISPPTITKQFLQSVIASGATSRIRFTISNPNNATLAPAGLTSVSFTDNLVNMSIAAPLYVGGNCTGLTHNAALGGSSFTATNIALAPSANCYIDLDVTSTTIGLHDNQTSGVSSNQTVGPGAPSNVAQLRVIEPVTLTKSFAAASVAADEPVRMTFTLTNPNPVGVPVSAPGFTDTFPFAPGQMSVAPVPNVAATCGIVVRNPANTAAPSAGDLGIYVRNGSVPANGSCTVALNVVANAAGNYTNTTSPLTTAGGIAPAASAPLTVVPRVSSIETTKTAAVTVANGANNGIVDAGDVVTYTVTIRNTGNTTLGSVGIASDTLTRLGGGALTLSSGPSFVSNSGGSAAGTLVPGEIATFTASYTLVQADVDAGGVSNTATGTGTPAGGPAVTDVSDDGIDTDGNTTDDPTETIIPRTPGLETTKTATVTVANGLSATATDAGDVVTYTIALRNTGNTTLTAVGIASDTLTRLNGGAVLALTSGPTFTSNSGPSAPGTLIPGETATFTASYTLVQADVDHGGVSNTATGTGTPPTGPAVTDVSDNGIDTDGNTTDDPTVTLIPAAPSIEATKTAVVTVANGSDPTKIDAGDVITYTITAQNTGNVTLVGVKVNDQLTRIGGPTLTLTSGPTFVSNSGSSAPTNLVPGETATFTASYTLVQADVDAGGVSNIAAALGTPPIGNQVVDVSDNGIDTDGNTTNDPTVTSIPRTPSIETTKTATVTVASGSSPTTTDAGDVVTYTITVRNTGNVSLTAVGIASDNLTRLGGGALALTSGPTFVSNSGSSPVGALAPGEMATFTATYTLVQADVDAGGVSNTATGTGTPPTGPAWSPTSRTMASTPMATRPTDPTASSRSTARQASRRPKRRLVSVANGLSLTATDAGDVVTYTISLKTLAT